jgi:hypothetical protein
VRTVLWVVDGAGGYIVGLIVMLATGQRRQRLGDLAAGTIVVDASAPALVPPVEESPVWVEPELASTAPVESATITLPSRPTPPATVADIGTPETPAMPEMRPFEPPTVADEAAVEVEDEPAPEVEDAPAPEVEDEPVEEVAAEEQQLPEISTPALDELAQDVAAAHAEPAPLAAVEDEPEDNEPITLRSVETVSAIDLVMGGGSEEDASSDQDPDDDPDPQLPAAG